MSDECARFRRALARGEQRSPHACSCVECAAFVEHWTAVEHELTAGANVTPPPDFAARVRSRLPQPPHPVVVMSLRLLPAALTLLAAAGLWMATTVSIGASDPLASTDDYLEWMVDDVLADAALLEGEAR